MRQPVAANLATSRRSRDAPNLSCPTPIRWFRGGCYRDPYKARNVVERAINKLKQHRAVATRFDKRDFVWRGTVDVAAIRIWLGDPVQ